MTDKPMRSPAVVIRAVRDAVPDRHAPLRNKLEEIAKDAFFQPPESPTPWLKLRDTLTSYIGEPREDWHRKVIDVVQNHPGIPE